MSNFVQSLPGSIFIIVTCTLVGLLTLFLLHRFWPTESRRPHNDSLGPAVGVIGTTYAVLIAFMLSGVWSDFESAEINAEQEANCLVNVSRLAEGLGEPLRSQIQQMAHDYATIMIKNEWPDMAAGYASERAHVIVTGLWNTVSRMQPKNSSEQLIMDHSISELGALTEHRRLRLLQSRRRLPSMLWAVLIAGGIVTVGATCLFGVSNIRLHGVQVFIISFLISLMLVAIADIQQPFRGDVHVEPDGFRFALETFDNTRHDLR